MAAKSRTAAPRRGRPSKKKTAQTELNRSWSILLFGLAGVLFALTYIRGAAAWNAVAGWLFGLFGVITYAVAPVTAFLAVLIAMGRPARSKFWQAGLLLCFACALALIFSKLDLTQGSFWQTFVSLGSAGISLRGGGLLSALIGWPLLIFCGRPAANVIIVIAVIVFFMLLTSTTPVDLWRCCSDKAADARERMGEHERTAAAARAEREERRRAEREAAEAELAAEEAARRAAAPQIDIPLDGAGKGAGADLPPAGKAAAHPAAGIDIPLGAKPAVPGASIFGGSGIDVPLSGAAAGPRDYGSAPPPPGIDMSAPFDTAPAGAAPAQAGTGSAHRAPFDIDLGPGASAAPAADTAAAGATDLSELERMVKKAAAPAQPSAPVSPAAEKAPVFADARGQTLLAPGTPGQNAYRHPPLSLFEKSKAAHGADENEL